MKSLVENCTKLGFGMMRLPRLDKDTFDDAQIAKMVDAFMAAGGRYFDTAFVYEGSEEATRRALVERYPRESFYLASKLMAASFACKSKEEAEDEIRISLERTGAGYLDFYLLHGLDADNIETYEKYDLWNYVKGLKEKGLIKHYGFSFHDTPETLDKILTAHPDAEFVQLQINYADWEEPSVQSRGCYEVAVKHDIPVIVMEPVKGGTLADPPEAIKAEFRKADPDASPASWAIRFVASLDQVMIVLSGMSTMEQMEDNLSYMNLKDYKPLDEAGRQTVENARVILESFDRIKCTGCHYCTPGCPQEIPIPEIFSTMNLKLTYGLEERAKNEYKHRFRKAKASDCVECGQCEEACPQHLHITSLLKDVTAALDS